MDISNSFRVSVPVDTAWHSLLDIERIAPCLPGAVLEGRNGDEYQGAVKVKVGPITARYQGRATLTEVDDAARHILIRASGRETRGQGNASATISVDLHPDGEGTQVAIETDLAITGRVAQLGRGVLADVSQELLAQFAKNLERDVLRAEAPAEGRSHGALPAELSPIEPVDLVRVSGAGVIRRLAPYLAGAVFLIALLRIIRHRRAVRP